MIQRRGESQSEKIDVQPGYLNYLRISVCAKRRLQSWLGESRSDFSSFVLFP